MSTVVEELKRKLGIHKDIVVVSEKQKLLGLARRKKKDRDRAKVNWRGV
jgi:predicted RNA-binding protein with PUA domain